MTTTNTAFVDFLDAVFRSTPLAADQADPFWALLDCLTYRPSIYRRNEIRWIAVHNWRSGRKTEGVAALRQVKQRPRRDLLVQAAEPIAATIRELHGTVPVEAITCVPCGHSRRHDCLGKRLAQTVAELLALPFVQIFADRFCPGVSHPKGSVNLPPLAPIARPPKSIMVIDDVATSGQHLEEIILALRGTGVSASAMAWISGASKAGTPLLEHRPEEAALRLGRGSQTRPGAAIGREAWRMPSRFWSRTGLCDCPHER
jgi:hypothetical protein